MSLGTMAIYIKHSALTVIGALSRNHVTMVSGDCYGKVSRDCIIQQMASLENINGIGPGCLSMVKISSTLSRAQHESAKLVEPIALQKDTWLVLFFYFYSSCFSVLNLCLPCFSHKRVFRGIQ